MTSLGYILEQCYESTHSNNNQKKCRAMAEMCPRARHNHVLIDPINCCHLHHYYDFVIVAADNGAVARVLIGVWDVVRVLVVRRVQIGKVQNEDDRLMRGPKSLEL